MAVNLSAALKFVKECKPETVKGKLLGLFQDYTGLDLEELEYELSEKEKELRPWLDDWVEHVKPYLGHCYNVEQLKEGKDKCCFSTYQPEAIDLGTEVGVDDQAQIPLQPVLLDGGCVGFRTYQPIGEESKTVFFCKNRYLNQVIVNFTSTGTPTGYPVTIILSSIPAGTNPPLSSVTTTSIQVNSGEELPVIFNIDPPAEAKHHQVAAGFDYFLGVQNNSGTDVNLSDITVSVVCGPLKCSKVKTECCVSLLTVPLGGSTPPPFPATGRTLPLLSSVGTGCLCILDDGRSFLCCAGQQCAHNHLESIVLSLPVDVEGGSEDTITALVELFAGDVKVTSATVDLPGAATTALQASLDPSEHHWITAKGPWSIRVSNLSSGVGDIILDGLGTIGVACSQPIKA